MKDKKVNKVLQTIDATISEFAADFNPHLLSREEREDIGERIDELLELMLKIKSQFGKNND
jgi:Trp operon repressor